MKQTIMVLLGITILLSACTSNDVEIISQTNDKLAEIKARGTLVIATDADYVPQSKLSADVKPDPNTRCSPTQYTANQFEGFDVDVAVAIAEHLGVEPCFVTPPWSQLVSGNWGDNWDIHVGSVAITFSRMKSLRFSQPYYATPTMVLVHEDNTTFKKIEDLSGKRIGVCVGCTFEEYLKGTLRLPGEDMDFRIHDAQVIGYQNEDPAIADLSLGDGVNLDAVITILPIVTRAMDAGLPVKILGAPLFFSFASVTMDRASKRDGTSLMNEINTVINELHKNGSLKSFSIKHQGQDLTQEAARFDLSAIQ